MMFHLNCAQQLRAQRWLVAGVIWGRAVSAQAHSQTNQSLTNGLYAQPHLLQPLDLLNHILSSQFTRARFGLSLCMAFIDTFDIVFVVSIFIAQHYFGFPF
jgi:hypothetical protein